MRSLHPTALLSIPPNSWHVLPTSPAHHLMGARLVATACDITSWTTPPSSYSRRPWAIAPTSSSSKLGLRRGKQRAPGSRLAKCMRARLGKSAWLAFVSHAAAGRAAAGSPSALARGPTHDGSVYGCTVIEIEMCGTVSE